MGFWRRLFGKEEAEREAPVPPLHTSASTAAALDAVEAAVQSSNDFGLALFTRASGHNACVSPASLSVALSMTLGGARGRTAAEMARALRIDDVDVVHEHWSHLLGSWEQVTDVELAIANRLFADARHPFLPDFVEATRSHYGAPLEPVDFHGAAEAQRIHINAWVQERTRERIRDLLPLGSIDAETRLVLANALYFKGDWDDPFPHTGTRDAPFHLSDGQRVTVQMMNHTSSYVYADLGDAELVEIPYEGHRFALTIVVPRAADGLTELVKRLSADRIDTWLAAGRPARLWLSLPRFELDPSESVRLKPILIAMGMPLAFDRNAADFSGISQPPDPDDRLCIGDVFHKTFVAVDEKGTEAAAATAVVMMRAGGPPAMPKHVSVDRPFLFLIRDVRSSAILFVGRVDDPR